MISDPGRVEQTGGWVDKRIARTLRAGKQESPVAGKINRLVLVAGHLLRVGHDTN